MTFFSYLFVKPSIEGVAQVAIEKSGNINTETWSGIIHVTGDINVQTGHVLTIEAGTQVICQGSYIIQGKGQIVAVGTSSNKIEFTCNTEVTPSWYGVMCGELGQIRGDLVHWQYVYCNFSNASKEIVRSGGNIGDYTYERGGALNAWAPQDLTVDNCTFTNCKAYMSGGAIYVNGDSFNRPSTITNNTFVNCISTNSFAGAMHISHGGVVDLRGNTYTNCFGSSTVYKNLSFTTNTSTNTIDVGKTHYLQNGFPLFFRAGSLPSPLQLNRKYFATSTTPFSNTFKVADTQTDALNNIAINLTTSGTSPKVDTLDEYHLFDTTGILE
jgi:hypothetical protein